MKAPITSYKFPVARPLETSSGDSNIQPATVARANRLALGGGSGAGVAALIRTADDAARNSRAAAASDNNTSNPIESGPASSTAIIMPKTRVFPANGNKCANPRGPVPAAPNWDVAIKDTTDSFVSTT